MLFLLKSGFELYSRWVPLLYLNGNRVGEANRPFVHYAPVTKQKEMTDEARVDNFIQVTVFVHPSVELASLCTGMREKSILHL